jgi:hypothetical protein
VTDQPPFIGDAAAFGERCATNNEARFLTGKWHVVPFDKNTFCLLRRSLHLNSRKYEPQMTRARKGGKKKEEDRQSTRRRYRW